MKRVAKPEAAEPEEAETTEHETWLQQVVDFLDGLTPEKKTELQFARVSYIDAGPIAMSLWGEMRPKERREKALRHYQDDPLAAWSYIYNLSLNSSIYAERYPDHLSLFGAKARKPLEVLAPKSEKAAIPLLRYLGQLGGAEAVPRLVELFTSSNKQHQQGSALGLQEVGHAATPALLPLLKGKKDLRMRTAELLASIGDPTAYEAIEAALQKEKLQDVRIVLQKALNASTKESSFDEKTPEELDALLQQQQRHPLLDEYPTDHLPALSWRQGGTLSQEATEGWLSLLMAETADNPSQVIRSLRDQMSPEALDAFTQQLSKCLSPYERQQTHPWIEIVGKYICSEEMLLGMHWGQQRFAAPQHDSRAAGLLLYSTEDVFPPSELARAKAQLSPQNVPTESDIRAFQEERADIAVLPVKTADKETQVEGLFNIEGSYQKTSYGPQYTTRWQLVHDVFPPLGKPAPALHVSLVSLEEEQTDAVQTYRVEGLRHRLTKGVHSELERYLVRLEMPQRQWTLWAWKKLFQQTPVWRLSTAALLFSTDDGTRFMCLPSRECIDVEGRVLASLHTSFVTLCDVEGLPPVEKQAWEQRHAELAKMWAEQRPQNPIVATPLDPLTDLRLLLSGEPSEPRWNEILSLLDALPDDEQLDVAVEYAASHLQQNWSHIQRGGMLTWLISLLLPIQDIYDRPLDAFPHLKRCLPASNQLSCYNIKLDKEHIDRMLEADLRNITSLYLIDCKFSDASLSHFIEQMVFPSLTELALLSNNGAALAGAASFQNLSALNTLGGILRTIIQTGVQEGLLDGLQSLTCWTNIGPTAPYLLAINECAQLAGLRSLTLTDSGLDDEGLIFLAEYSQFSMLETFNLSYNESLIGMAGIEALARSERFPQLKTLCLCKKPEDRDLIPEEVWRCLLASKTLPKAALASLEK